MDIKEILLLWFIIFLIKKASGSGVATLANKFAANNKIKQNQQLAEELHKQIIRKFKKRRVYSSFKDNIWGADLVDIQLISKFNKGIRFLLCVIDIYCKYAQVVPLEDKKGVFIVNTFQKILNDLKRKPKKYGLRKEVDFITTLFKDV